MPKTVPRHAVLGGRVFLVDNQFDRLATPHPDCPNTPLDRGALDAALKFLGQHFVTQDHRLRQPPQFEGRQQRIASSGYERLAVDQQVYSDPVE